MRTLVYMPISEWNPATQDFNLLQILLSSTLGLPQYKHWNQEGPHSLLGSGKKPFLFSLCEISWGFLYGSVKESSWQFRRSRFDPWPKIHWRRKLVPTSILENPMDRRTCGIQSTGPPRVGMSYLSYGACTCKRGRTFPEFQRVVNQEEGRCRDKGGAAKEHRAVLERIPVLSQGTHTTASELAPELKPHQMKDVIFLWWSIFIPERG